jgi:hypothetical protein
MLYRDLVQFDPIESVIQLREADDPQRAKHLVETYVISDHMADLLVNVVIPQLQLDRPLDNKGILIVGNYGTGKSHLMSLLSAICEYADMVASVNHPEVRQAAIEVAGRFKVLRVEITSERSLRDSLLEELEIALDDWGTPYRFPAADQVTNNKDILIEAVAGFQTQHPDQGLLLVLDELLDYLRTREERQLILDLSFLRELGEVAALTPFRFIGGVQETLFDSPRFSFVAQQLRRVRDRFEQIRIVREDITYVVSERLLHKTDQQLAWITEHLRAFTPLYQGMAERLTEFAALFPIHPAYLETFERVYVVEKRQVLHTISRAMRELMDQEVPADAPGLVSYDHYWDVLRGNPSMRTLPGVAEVVEKSNVLEGRVSNAYTRPHLLPTAQRIIHALSVHRLTTNDIHVPLGVTAEELRDQLCLYMRLPEHSAEFLLDQVRVALQEIMRTVSGQYITFNEDNGQYYLDVKKDIDFDSKIKERGELMDRADLNRYFFDALGQVLNKDITSSYVRDFRIWLYELAWADHKVTRPGYLCFTPPDERSTAQPPRDFYLYFLPPFVERDGISFYDTQADEVVVQLTGLDQAFESQVRLYAGARAMANESATHRDVYAEKATGRGGYLAKLNRWLNEHLTAHLRVCYEGVTHTVPEVLAQTRSSASRSIEDLLELMAAHLLAPHFRDQYPDYPAFSRLSQSVTETARRNTAMEAVRALAGHGRTNLARAVLAGLELTDDDNNVRPHQSRYAQRYLAFLQDKPAGQVVNRGELIEIVGSFVDTIIEKDIPFKLEPEWSVVILLALVYNGDIVLNLDGQSRLDAGNIERAATMAMATLTDFRHYGRPRTLPLPLWTTIFEGLDLAPGLIRDEATVSREQAVRQLQEKVSTEIEKAATVQGRLQAGLQLWNRPLFTDRYTIEVQAGVVVGTDLPAVTLSSTELVPYIRCYKEFLENLSRFKTVGRLRNLRMTATEINDALGGRAVLARAETLLRLVERIQPLTAYLAEAEANLTADHPWPARAVEVRRAVLEKVRRMGKGEIEVEGQATLRDLEALKADYIVAYAELHRQMVLGPDADARRQRLYNDPRLGALKQLVRVELLAPNHAELDGWNQAVSGLRACTEFHEGLLADTPLCTCGLRPAHVQREGDAAESLDYFDQRLGDMLLRWQQALRAGLTSETAQGSLAAMSPAERSPIEQFLTQRDDDPTIAAGFVADATRALRGIQALALPVGELIEALKTGGLPCTVADLQERFSRFVREAMGGHDARNTRLTLDE